MDKFIKWFEDNKTVIALVVALVVIVYLILEPKIQPIGDNEVVIQKKEFSEAIAKKLNAEAGCDVAKTEQIIQLSSLPTLQDMLPSGSVILDLTTFKKNKTEIKGDKIYTYYFRHGENSEYYTVATPKPIELIKVEAK